jgi:hypothetical protein
MLGYICLGAYGIYCCTFCSMVIYTECKERYEAYEQRRNEYRQISQNLPNIEISMTNESDYAKSRLSSIPEEEEELEEIEEMEEIV